MSPNELAALDYPRFPTGALKVQGGVCLRGEVQVPGSKNVTLPVMVASLLSSGSSVLWGMPDVCTFTQMLKHMGLRAKCAAMR